MTIYSAKDLYDNYQTHSEYRSNRDRFKTGFENLDECFENSGSGLVLLGSRPAMGRMAFNLSLIVNRITTQNDFTAVIFSSKCEPDMIFCRLASILSNVSIFNLNDDDLNEEETERVETAMEFLSERNIYLVDSQLTVQEIRNVMKSILAKAGTLDLVVIDGLADILPEFMDGNTCADGQEFNIPIGSTHRMLSLKSDYYVDICGELSEMAKKTGCQVIATVTLSRLVEMRDDHHPQLADLRNYDGRICEAADIILLLYRDEYYHWDDDICEGRLEINIAKNVTGQKGRVTLYFDKDTSGVTEMPSRFGGDKESDFPF